MRSTLVDISYSREEKFQFARSLVDRPKQTAFELNCVYHGVALRFFFESSALLSAVKKFLPDAWLEPAQLAGQQVTEVFWLDPEKIFSTRSWQDDPNSDCEIIQLPNAEVAVQRDFIGLNGRNNFAVIIASQALDDGFFNALRWLIPRKMTQFDHILLHSSCMVGRNGLAYFFLGPSGAGKTTITSMAQGRLVLGDDMNVLGYAGGELTAEAGALGQRFYSTSLFGRKFPVGGLFWLKQSERNFVNPVSRSKGALALLSSCANLFWKESQTRLAPEVLAAIEKISATQPLYELEFNLTGGFWEHVDITI